MFDALTAFVPGRVVNWWLAMRGKNAMHKVPPWFVRSRYNPLISRRDYMVPARERWRDQQLLGTSGSTIMMDADATVAAMAGVTIRRPLADVDLWEFFLSLRGEVKFPLLQWKALARQALRGVIPTRSSTVRRRRCSTTRDAADRLCDARAPVGEATSSPRRREL